LAVALSWLTLVGGPADGIEWTAPRQCPAASMVSARFVDLTDRGDALAGLDASASVEARGDGRFVATVRLRGVDAGFERVVVADDCALLAEAVALVLAVHADALAVATSTEPILQHPQRSDAKIPLPAPRRDRPTAAADRATPAEPDAPDTRAQRDQAARPASASAVRGALRLAGGVAVPLLPEPAATFDVEASLLVRRLRFEALGIYAFEQPARLDLDDVDAGADIDLAGGGLRIAFVPAVGRFEFPLHAGIVVGDMRARGRGVRNPRTRHGLWVAADAGAGLAFVATPRVAIALRPSLIVALRRPTFGVRVDDEDRALFEPGVAGFRVTLGPQLRFP
jgi:hypothetical protein